MITDVEARSVRLGSWWVRRYTAGLPRPTAHERVLEIESDLIEHRSSRAGDGWPDGRIDRESTTRLVRGIPADLAWRHDVLSIHNRSTNGILRWSVLAVTTVASLLVAAYYAAFSAYAAGDTSIAEQRFLGGMENYADKADGSAESVVFAIVLASFSAVLVGAAVLRPIAPFAANVFTASTAIFLVLFFWLGMVPVAVVAVGGSIADMVLRSPAVVGDPA